MVEMQFELAPSTFFAGRESNFTVALSIGVEKRYCSQAGRSTARVYGSCRYLAATGGKRTSGTLDFRRRARRSFSLAFAKRAPGGCEPKRLRKHLELWSKQRQHAK